MTHPVVVLIQFDNDKYEDADDAEPPMDDKSLLILEAQGILKKATLARRATTVWAFSPGPQERIEFGIEQLWRCNFWVNTNDRGLHGHCQNRKMWQYDSDDDDYDEDDNDREQDLEFVTL